MFAALMFIPGTGDNKFLRLGLLAGWISQLLQAFAMYSEIRRIKKGKDKQLPTYRHFKAFFSFFTG